METTFIYTLSDKDGNIRYIGKSNTPRKRLYAHIKECKTENLSHKISWVKSLLAKNELPIIDVLDEVPVLEWEKWETYWIEQFRQWGFNLTNISVGGYNNNYKRSILTKDRMRKSKLGTILSEEHKEKISISVKEKAKENPYYNRGLGNSKIILDKDELYQLYIVDNLSMPKISNLLNISEKVVFNNITDYGFTKDKSIWRKQCANGRIPESISVLQYDKLGNFIKEWNGCSEIYRETGIKAQRSCSGARKTVGGYIWKYKK